MAIYHCSIKIISRGKGKSAVAAAAYRAGELIKNEYDGIVHDYTHKGGVVHTEILLPGHAPAAYADRAVLWNAVEKVERYRTAQLAREIELALPVELTREQGIALAREYVRRQFVAAGMCADLCVHDKGDGNPHAHILLTMRPLEQDGSWGAKSRTVDGKKVTAVDWHGRDKVEQWRAAWAEAVNAELERRGIADRIDHRSFARQGVEQIPTVHLGVAASQMERKGVVTDRGRINREIEVSNKLLRQLKARISKLQSWLKSEAASTAPPSLADVIQDILSRHEQNGQSSRYGKIRDLKAAADMLNFLTANGIRDMAGLRDKVGELHERRMDFGGRLNRIDRRLKTLDEHLLQAGYYRQHREIFQQYQSIVGPKQREIFRNEHHAEIALYEAAKRYLDGVMNGRTSLPVKAWRDERGRLANERAVLNRKYASLKDEVQSVERVRRSAENIMREEMLRLQPTRENGIAM